MNRISLDVCIFLSRIDTKDNFVEYGSMIQQYSKESRSGIFLLAYRKNLVILFRQGSKTEEYDWLFIVCVNLFQIKPH